VRLFSTRNVKLDEKSCLRKVSVHALRSSMQQLWQQYSSRGITRRSLIAIAGTLRIRDVEANIPPGVEIVAKCTFDPILEANNRRKQAMYAPGTGSTFSVHRAPSTTASAMSRTSKLNSEQPTLSFINNSIDEAVGEFLDNFNLPTWKTRDGPPSDVSKPNSRSTQSGPQAQQAAIKLAGPFHPPSSKTRPGSSSDGDQAQQATNRLADHFCIPSSKTRHCPSSDGSITSSKTSKSGAEPQLKEVFPLPSSQKRLVASLHRPNENSASNKPGTKSQQALNRLADHFRLPPSETRPGSSLYVSKKTSRSNHFGTTAQQAANRLADHFYLPLSNAERGSSMNQSGAELRQAMNRIGDLFHLPLPQRRRANDNETPLAFHTPADNSTGLTSRDLSAENRVSSMTTSSRRGSHLKMDDSPDHHSDDVLSRLSKHFQLPPTCRGIPKRTSATFDDVNGAMQSNARVSVVKLHESSIRPETEDARNAANLEDALTRLGHYYNSEASGSEHVAQLLGKRGRKRKVRKDVMPADKEINFRHSSPAAFDANAQGISLESLLTQLRDQSTLIMLPKDAKVKSPQLFSLQNTHLAQIRLLRNISTLAKDDATTVAANSNLGRYKLTVKEIRKLLDDTEWLNDEIINAWFEMHRDVETPSRWLNANTFFWPKVAQREDKVFRWFPVRDNLPACPRMTYH